MLQEQFVRSRCLGAHSTPSRLGWFDTHGHVLLSRLVMFAGHRADNWWELCYWHAMQERNLVQTMNGVGSAEPGSVTTDAFVLECVASWDSRPVEELGS